VEPTGVGDWIHIWVCEPPRLRVDDHLRNCVNECLLRLCYVGGELVVSKSIGGNEHSISACRNGVWVSGNPNQLSGNELKELLLGMAQAGVVDVANVFGENASSVPLGSCCCEQAFSVAEEVIDGTLGDGDLGDDGLQLRSIPPVQLKMANGDIEESLLCLFAVCRLGVI